MDLDPTDEQRALTDAVDSLLEKRYEPNARLQLLDSERGWSEDMWRQYADMGLLGLTIPEQFGGAGMGQPELATVMESFGKSLILEPFVAGVVLGSAAVERAGTPEQQAEILPDVAAGEVQLAFAWAEPDARWSRTDISTHASPTDGAPGGWAVSGTKSGVLGGDSADRIVVTALTPAGELGLFLVAGSDVTRRSYVQQDGLRAADVVFTSAPAVRLGGDSLDATAVVDDVIDAAIAALCSEAVGAMDRMLWLTVDYLKTRVQFGTPIAVFQALQHRAADMYIAFEQARSMALMAQLALRSSDPAERHRAVRAAKLQIDDSAKLIGQEAIQMHGGIGMTMEYPVGHYVKRTSVIAKTFDDTDGLLEQVGAGSGLIATA